MSVLGGFIGATESGVPTTLGRGGSDFTASLAGAAVNAEEIQIWTDVDGMLSCDPRVISGGRCLRAISYVEAAEMAEWGAKVLHPSTVAPAVRQRIPVSIRNSRNPSHPGTRIDSVPSGRQNGLVKSIACMKDVTVIRIHSTHPSVLTIFRKHEVPFHVMDGTRVTEATVHRSSGLAALVAELNSTGRVEVEEGLAAVSLIGQGIDGSQGFFSHVRKTLATRAVAFHAVATAPMRLTFLVAEQELQLAAEGLHDEFVKFQENGPFYREFETKRSRAAIADGRQALTPVFC
jgi:aspartate kinase